MNRSCFHANRGYLIGVTVIVLCLLAVLHPGTKARLTFSKEVRPSLINQSTPEPCAPITHPAYSAQGQRASNYGRQLWSLIHSYCTPAGSCYSNPSQLALSTVPLRVPL